MRVVRHNKEGKDMRWFVVSIALALNVVAFADEKPHENPRSTVEAYLAAALAGKTAEAASLATEDREASSVSTLQDFKKMFDVKQIKVPTLWMGEKSGRAIAVTEPVQIAEADPDGRNTGRLLFDLVKSKDKWLVDGVDFDNHVEAKVKVEEFKKTNLDARSLPLKPLN